jgi:hypothetical protein
VLVPLAGVKAMHVDLTGIEVGDGLELCPEPSNEYDANAISVRHAGRPIGYLQRELAAKFGGDLAPMGSVYNWHATVAEILNFDGAPAGLRIDLSRTAPKPVTHG